MVDYAKIDEVLRSLALNNWWRLNAYQVAYLSGNSDVNAVFQYLVSKEPYILQRSYEVQCPNHDSTLAYSRIEEIPKKWVECRICGEEFIPDPSNIFVVFNFTSSYISQLKDLGQNTKNSQRPMALMQN